jgi:hypothetical protein
LGRTRFFNFSENLNAIGEIIAASILERPYRGERIRIVRIAGRAFTAEDFCLMHLAAKDLSLLLGKVESESVPRLKLVA